MKSRKKKTNKKTDVKSEAELREHYEGMGPMNLKKYAAAAYNIPKDIVDTYNDFDFLIEYCICKDLGKPLPKQEDFEDNGFEDSGEFDATGLVEENGNEEDEDNFEDEMDGGGTDMFADQTEEEEKEEEPTPEPQKPKAAKKKRAARKPKAEAPPADVSVDLSAQFATLLDVITNQGAILDELKKLVVSQSALTKSIYLRQEAAHKALAMIGRSSHITEATMTKFSPRALKAMRYNLSASKAIRSDAKAAGTNAEEFINSLLDSESD